MITFNRKESGVAVIGEPLIEVIQNGDSKENFSVAGDVFNVAVAMSKLSVPTKILTAVGTDEESRKLLSIADEYGMDCKSIVFDPDKRCGRYTIFNDEAGERSFSYDREDSAARNFFMQKESILSELVSLKDVSVVYFSAITLSLMSSESLVEFCDWLDEFREFGGLVAFDNNYRPQLWTSPTNYLLACEKVLKRTDIFLPSLEDVLSALNTNDRSQAMDWILKRNVAEVVVSDGVRSMTVVENGRQENVTVNPADYVVDTTGAGDAFNGGYLSARWSGLSSLRAVKVGMRLARDVVGNHGAILPDYYWRSDLSSNFMKEYDV